MIGMQFPFKIREEVL